MDVRIDFYSRRGYRIDYSREVGFLRIGEGTSIFGLFVDVG